MQNKFVGQETAFTSPIVLAADQLTDQLMPLNVSTFPALSAAMQNELVGHDMASTTFGASGSRGPDQPAPSYVKTSPELPAEPLATQKALEAHETPYSAPPDPSDVGADQFEPS
jgi:hypothetical protein